MPIVRNFGPNKDATVIELGSGDTHVVHAILTDKLTGLPEIERSMVMFVEFETKELATPGFQPPDPAVSISFTSMAMVDHFIHAMQIFKAEFLKKFEQATKTTAQA